MKKYRPLKNTDKLVKNQTKLVFLPDDGGELVACYPQGQVVYFSRDAVSADAPDGVFVVVDPTQGEHRIVAAGEVPDDCMCDDECCCERVGEIRNGQYVRLCELALAIGDTSKESCEISRGIRKFVSRNKDAKFFVELGEKT